MSLKSHLSRLLIGTAILAGITALASCTTPSSTSTTPGTTPAAKVEATTAPANAGDYKDFSTYENANEKIRVKFPTDWKKSEESQEVIVQFFSPQQGSADTFLENVNINTEDLSGGSYTLDEYEQASIAGLKKAIPNMTLVDSVSTKLAGSPAKKITFTANYKAEGQEEGRELKWMQVYTVKNNKGYIVTYTGEATKFAEFLPTVDKIVASFETI